jgi:hypothetical protein
MPNPSIGQDEARRGTGDISVFVSYSHKDNTSTHGRIEFITEDVANTYSSMTGLDVDIFFDQDSIKLGEMWKDRIRSGLNSATILLAFISPGYLQSVPCREELTEFLVFLQSTKARKLVIPILLFGRDRIDRNSDSDELWAQICSMQSHDGSSLRTETRGSSSWMKQIVKIAERVEEIFLELKGSNDSDILLADTERAMMRIDNVDEPGTLELIAIAEARIPEIGEYSLQYGALMDSFRDEAVRATPRLEKADTFGQRLAISNDLAKRFDPVADEGEAVSRRLREALDATSPGIVSLIRMIASSGELGNPDVVKAVAGIWLMATQGIGASEKVEELIVAIEGSKGRSAALDKPLKRMQNSLLRFVEARTHFSSWIEEIDRLQIEEATLSAAVMEASE